MTENNNERREGAKGFLALVATPIGNLEDITLRAVRILQEATLIASEDTRKAMILLGRHGIEGKKIVSYHTHNEHHMTRRLVDEALAGGKVVVISEAGTPCLSDPGFLIVREAVRSGIEPLIVPGVSALTFAVAACGLPVERFCFHGFLPVKSGRRRKALEEIAQSTLTAFIYESPHRIEKLAAEIVEVMGPDVQVALIREATKLHEQIIRGSAAEVVEKLKSTTIKGEFVVAVSPRMARLGAGSGDEEPHDRGSGDEE